MTNGATTSDEGLLEMLRVSGPVGVAELASQMEVTATAVRQRLTRMMASGLIQREAVRSGRGRPWHCYQLTQKGLRLTGSNFADLALVLWREVRSIEDSELRLALLTRVVKALANDYSAQIDGKTTTERMQSLSRLLRQRRVPFSVGGDAPELPVLTAHACPYPELAEQDRGICLLEKMLFTELLRENVDLSECRLDGANCCRFEPTSNVPR